MMAVKAINITRKYTGSHLRNRRKIENTVKIRKC